MITNRLKLAKTSSQPGKTQLINHFLINENWYLVDLPGYGYAKISKEKRSAWSGFTKEYLIGRDNLMCVFVLIDSRIEPQKIDIEFINELGVHGLPLCLVFTKTDKQSAHKTEECIREFSKELLKTWEKMPVVFKTSATEKKGRDEILDYIENANNLFRNE
jgi:GTP-binding protein